jgi:uncharacterized protein (TIGR02246 family)
MTSNPTELASALFADLEKAWNAGDGSAFGVPFADHTDFVDSRGTHHRGAGSDVGQAHQGIFDSIYRGSTVRYNVTDARELANGCIIAHVAATLDAPVGPMAGTNSSVISAIIVGDSETARITAFHNTIVMG